jgi:lipopolysaccharide biosynthesis protein
LIYIAAAIFNLTSARRHRPQAAQPQPRVSVKDFELLQLLWKDPLDGFRWRSPHCSGARAPLRLLVLAAAVALHYDMRGRQAHRRVAIGIAIGSVLAAKFINWSIR